MDDARLGACPRAGVHHPHQAGLACDGVTDVGWGSLRLLQWGMGCWVQEGGVLVAPTPPPPADRVIAGPAIDCVETPPRAHFCVTQAFFAINPACLEATFAPGQPFGGLAPLHMAAAEGKEQVWLPGTGRPVDSMALLSPPPPPPHCTTVHLHV
jgi:hypothetical protein